jgi:hypothetical protein
LRVRHDQKGLHSQLRGAKLFYENHEYWFDAGTVRSHLLRGRSSASDLQLAELSRRFAGAIGSFPLIKTDEFVSAPVVFTEPPRPKTKERKEKS